VEKAFGQHGDANLNNHGTLTLKLWCTNVLYSMNTFFQHRDRHKYNWCRDPLSQQSLVGFCVVTADLFQSMLDVCLNECTTANQSSHGCLQITSVKTTGPKRRRRTNGPDLAEALVEKNARKIFAQGYRPCTVSSRNAQLT